VRPCASPAPTANPAVVILAKLIVSTAKLLVITAKLLVITAKLLVITAKLLVITAKAGTQLRPGSPLSRG
jgi:hypothetical protein